MAREVLERDVLRALTTAAKRAGIRVVRMALQASVEVGFPDVMLLPDGGPVMFVECKRPGGKLSKIQEFVVRDLLRRGYAVSVVDTVAGARAYVAGIANGDCAPAGVHRKT